MKIIECTQGSAEWHKARLGIPTASNFDCIVTMGGKGVTGKTRQSYLLQLLAERITGQLTQNYVSPAMERGTTLEPQARAWYELTTGCTVQQVGFALPCEGGRYGCSPDGLCEDRGIEIKCPLPHTLLGQLLNDAPPEEYYLQVQACMWITGRPRWDLVLFSGMSAIPNRIHEISADEKMHAAFAEHVNKFADDLDAAEAKLLAIGARRATANSNEVGWING